MVRRPKEWENWTQEKRMTWLREQRTQYKGGRKRSLKKEDRQAVWTLIKKTGNNKSMVADLLDVSRRTVIRFLKDNPMPTSFVMEKSADVTDFPEIKTWLKRLRGFAKQNTINNYLVALRKFYEYMKKKRPERAKPSIWTSEDIIEWVYSLPSHLWHWAIVPLRSLALKTQSEFPNIELGLLPTKKTHRAKKSLAGKEEYYYTPKEVDAMIRFSTTTKAKALIAFLYNIACRTLALTNARRENLNLEKHRMLIKDKGSVWWNTYGMTDKTAQLLAEYLEERGYPESGWLFVNKSNSRETKMTSNDVNKIIKEAGQKACIKDKILTAKAFRKSFVENFFKILNADPMILAGSGKGTQGQPKTAFCVGWSPKVLMEHYAPKMRGQIETHRQQFAF